MTPVSPNWLRGHLQSIQTQAIMTWYNPTKHRYYLSVQLLQIIIIACTGISSTSGIYIYMSEYKHNSKNTHTHLPGSLIQSIIILNTILYLIWKQMHLRLSLLYTDEILICKNTSHTVGET